MDKKKYIDVLTEQASKHGRPQEMALMTSATTL